MMTDDGTITLDEVRGDGNTEDLRIGEGIFNMREILSLVREVTDMGKGMLQEAKEGKLGLTLGFSDDGKLGLFLIRKQ